MWRSWWGLLLTGFATVQGNEFERRRSRSGRTPKIRRKIAYILAGIQGLVLGVILCPLGVIYVLGLYISAGVSLWRLIENEYGDAGGANQKPALQVLYSLALAQGVLFGYKFIHARVARKKLAKFAADGPGMVEEELLAEYLKETLAGCEKDPSFAKGRNLVTYGVDLMMEAKSNEGFTVGIRVLGGAIKEDWPSGRKVLAKHLLARPDSWSHIMQRLIDTVGPRSPYSREVREHAARIVALVARGIRLEQFSGVIEFISSVLDPSSSAEEESNRQQLEGMYQQYIKKKESSARANFFSPIKDYERIELLERYELEYIIAEIKDPGAHRMQRLALLRSSLSNAAAAGQMPTTASARERQEERRIEMTPVLPPREGQALHGLLEDALSIIPLLAVDADNRRIMNNTVIHKFASAPLGLHRYNHEAILDIYWVQWLLAAIKETNSQGRILEAGQPAAASSAGAGGRQRSGKEILLVQEEEEEGAASALGNAIKNIKDTISSIFDCLDCPATQKMQAILILLYLSLNMSFIMDTESRTRRLAWILALICYASDDDLRPWSLSGFTDRHAFSSIIKDLAREKLSTMVPAGQSALLSTRFILEDLSSALDEDISIRTHAAIILQGVCVGYKPDHGEEVKGILVRVIPKVVKEILIRCASTREGRQAHAGDVENGVVSEDDALASRINQDSDADNERLLKAWVSLSRDGYMKNNSLGPKFKKLASDICRQRGKSFEDFKSLLD